MKIMPIKHRIIAASIIFLSVILFLIFGFSLGILPVNTTTLSITFGFLSFMLVSALLGFIFQRQIRKKIKIVYWIQLAIGFFLVIISLIGLII
ncbi:MAG: hypothetical protein KC506_02805, partial [Nanoarchaeota archaeon]|nr:hypothetical protein [Nanoarchaeota archaeon]